jgi:SAM-dependent methyltransferase
VDPQAYREEARRRWADAAAGWERRRAAFQAANQPVSMWLVEQVAPQPGQTILELAAGPGDTGLLAAELVHPGGRVILTDAAEPMVEVARRRAEELGVRNVETRVMDAEWIDLSAASVDGVLCRYGYMLLADPAAGLRETRRVLRPGGRVALAVWAAPAENPWAAAISEAIFELGFADRPQPGEPGPFALAEPGRIGALLDETGFTEVVVETISFAYRFPGLDAHFDHQRDMSPLLRDVAPRLSPAEHARLRDAVDARLAPYVRKDGSVELPARTWVAAATA